MLQNLRSCCLLFIQSLTLAMLLTWTAYADTDWAEHRNLEPDPARAMGWSFEVPQTWKQATLASFPYPLGESWNGSDGCLQVCWLGNSFTAEQEQYNLEERGFIRSNRTVAGRSSVWLQKNSDSYCYIKLPKGTCRLHLTGATPITDRVLQSFTLLETQETVATRQKFSNWSFALPNGWAFKEPDLLVFQGEAVARLSTHGLAANQMTRGWARNQAAQENPKLQERSGMEPFSSTAGVDGYLVEWRGSSGPLLYAYAARSQRGLRIQLLRNSELEHLRRLLKSLAFQDE